MKVSPFFRPLYFLTSSLQLEPSRVRVVDGNRLTFLFSLSHPSHPLSSIFLALHGVEGLHGRKTNTRTGSGSWCRARHDSRYKEITRGPERLCVHKSRRIALSRWLPPYRRRNDTPGDRRRMRRKGSGRERLARAMQGAKGWRASERGCFSTTSCSRHPQTPLDPDATPKEKERERGREVEKVERRLADHKSPKLVSNRPLCSFLSSTFWPLRPGYTHTRVRAFYGYTRYDRVAYT